MSVQDQAPQSFSEAIGLWDRAVGTANYMLDNWWVWPFFLFVLWLVVKIRNQHALLGELDERCEAAFADMDALLAERHR